MLTLGQSFDAMCPSVPDVPSLLEYGYYNEYNGQKDMFKSASAGNAAKMFRDVVNIFQRARPHFVELAHSDAETFLIFQQDPSGDYIVIDPDDCLTPQTRHLYKNVALLAEQRRTLPPDVEDDAGFMAQLRPDAQKELGFNPRAPRVTTAAQAMKKGCTKYTATAAALGQATDMEIFCRCLVDAAVLADLPDADMRTLGTTFDDRTLKSASDHYPAFAAKKRACYH